MSSPRQRLFSQGASTAALSAAVDGVAAPAPMLAADADMGDATSQAALTRLKQAVAELKTMTIRPLLSRAVAALGAEDHATASALALKALGHDDRNGVAWYLLAIAREKASDFKSSIRAYEAALALTPNHVEIANDLGRLAYRLGMKSVAAQLFQHYCAAHPDCAQGANNLACALRDLHHYDDAVEVIRPAIMAHPDNPPLWNTLGTILGEQGEMAGALTFFDEALRLDPDFAKARYNRANTRLDLGDNEGALIDCEAAMPGAPTPSDLMMMKLARATMLHCIGRVGEGWDSYEARLDPAFSDVTNFMIDRPRWTPDSDLAGKSLLLMGEQGLGDEVMFANILPDVLEALGPDGRLSIALEPRLKTLFQRSFPTVEVGAHATYKVDGHTVRGAPFIKDQAVIDLWTPMASPLRRFRRSADAFPRRDRFLVADPQRVEHWRGVLSERPGLKIGVLWKSLKLEGSRLRYFSPFEAWRPVLQVPGVSFVNLQYGDCAAELAQARDELGLEIWQPPGIDLKNDLDDVAALGCALDLIIGPANATSNIAAACGADVWLISTLACWPRLGTRHYPWYPQMRVFIPDAVGAWAPMMEEVAAALADRVASRR
jgi:tetratricopeptide (TPR) repeat protein